MTPVFRPGSWCDVSPGIDGRLMQVTSDGPLVRCYLEDALIWEQAAPEPLLFCRAVVHQGLVLSVHQGHDTGAAWLIGNGLVRSLGPTFGVQPVAIDARYAYVVRSGYLYERIDLHTGETMPGPSEAPGSSQGISDVAENGSLWWADLHRSMDVNGTIFTYPNVRTPVLVGQADPPQIAAAVDGIVSPVLLGDGFEPHVAVSGPRAAVCARTPHGAAYAVLNLPVLTRQPGPVNR